MARYFLVGVYANLGMFRASLNPSHLCYLGGIDCWFMSNIVNSVIAIRDTTIEVQFPRQCEDDYLEWYIIVSHPHITPPVLSMLMMLDLPMMEGL